MQVCIHPRVASYIICVGIRTYVVRLFISLGVRIRKYIVSCFVCVGMSAYVASSFMWLGICTSVAV